MSYIDLTGAYSWSVSQDIVTLRVDRIENDSFFATSGTLRLELWASTQYYTGGTLDGYRIAVAPLNFIDGDAKLSPGEYYFNISTTSSQQVRPPDGFYNVTLVVGEFTNDRLNDGYSIADWEVSTSFLLQPPLGYSTFPTNGMDWLGGTAFNDTIDGLAGDDVMFGGRGNDFYNGGFGNDTVLFSGNSWQYSVSYNWGTRL